MSSNDSIRPFQIDIPEESLQELRRRVAVPRWPDRETVSDRTQGAQLAKVQELVDYWATDYDWRKLEAKLNALPQFITEIDGLDIHFFHVRSPHANALPLIMTHGWPGSFLEFVKLIGPLSDPESHGARAEDAFDLVVPSMPGFGFSARPQATGWNPDRIAGAWVGADEASGLRALRLPGWRLGCGRHGRDGPPGAGGSRGYPRHHVARRDRTAPTPDMQTAVPPEVANALKYGEPAPAGLSAEETIAYEGSKNFAARGSGFRAMNSTRPQTIGYSLADSPVGLAAWFYEKFAGSTDTDGEPERALTKDEMLDDITLYWLTNTAASSARLYWENSATRPGSAA